MSKTTESYYETFEDPDPPLQFGFIQPLKSVYQIVDFNELMQDTTLDCSNKTISIELLGKFLLSHPTISNLNLSNCDIKYYKLYKLTHNFNSAFNNITSLDLSNNPLGNRGLHQFINYSASNNALKQLSYLSLNNCNIHDYGYKIFLLNINTAFPKLYKIDFSNNKIKEAFKTLLYISNENMLKLQLLDLTNNPIDDGDIENLQKLMVYNGYQCKLKTTTSDKDLTDIFNIIFKDHIISEISVFHNIEITEFEKELSGNVNTTTCGKNAE